MISPSSSVFRPHQLISPFIHDTMRRSKILEIPMPTLPLLRKLAVVLLFSCSYAQAEQGDLFGMIENKPLSETWLNAGFYSYHLNRDKGLNDRNLGLGVEYRFSTVASVTAGRFYNSDRAYSNYVGVYYQPLFIGPARLGVVAGGFNGYPKMQNGGWFLAAIPVVSVDYQRVGLNLAFIPNYKDRLYGALTFQAKVKID
ncbi:hypothetical protein [Paraherbaspirillum soli]|uniref:Uncharacterized protein n=1 Tax=Paraherbaspirillum soli TaxID=631222 RepID=A0ABW0MH16_9BURK